MAALSAASALSTPIAAARFNRRAGSRDQSRRAGSATARRALRVVAADVETYDTVIVGAGVSGLSTAFTLGRSNPGVKMLVTEARNYVGGNINTKSKVGGARWSGGRESNPSPVQHASYGCVQVRSGLITL